MVGFGVDGAGFDVSDRNAVEKAFRAFEPDARVISSFGHKWLQDPFAQGTCNYRPGSLRGGGGVGAAEAAGAWEGIRLQHPPSRERLLEGMLPDYDLLSEVDGFTVYRRVE